MDDILFLAHRIPYPPDKGDKIRAWHILRHLASRYRVHLCAFIDDPEDTRGIQELEKICASVFWRPLTPRLAKLRSLPCLLNGMPLTQGYFGDRRIAAHVDDLIARYQPALLYVFSSAMYPYVASHAGRLVIDMVDVDSEKWRQYAEASSGLARFVYSREARTLLALERRAAMSADAVIFVSRAEAELFRNLVPEAACRTHFVNNGVDTELFDPSMDFPNPLGNRAAIVFTGAMDYRPNIEAMSWFSERVMPVLRQHPKSPCLWIVGSNPSPAVLALAGPDVRVTGRVRDTRPYLRHATAVVAPLRIARGVQNKVLEAMAMSASIVVTPQAREGLEMCGDDELLTAVAPGAFAAAVARILDGAADAIGDRARARVVRDYAWQPSLSSLDRVINAASVPATPPMAVSCADHADVPA